MILIPCLAISVAVQAWLLRRLRFGWVVVAIACAAAVLYFHYLGYTSVADRNYDGSSQLEYIQILAKEGRRPHLLECGVCGHPPLYYLLGAVWGKVTSVGSWLPAELSLQWLSVLLFCGFVTCALLVVRSILGDGPSAWLAALLIVFWPTSIMNSVRVHNDALAAPLLLASMYFAAQWDARERQRDFVLALTTAAFALLTKANGYTVAATLLLLCVFRLLAAKDRSASIKRCLVAVLVLGAAAALAVNVREAPRETSACEKVFGSACSGRGRPPVPDSVTRFVAFDPRAFLHGTETFSRDAEGDYFLNRFSKSSLFGSADLGDEFASEGKQALATGISALFLSLVALVALRLLVAARPDLRTHRAYWLAAAVMIACLIAFRVRAPNGQHEDFRHVFPLLVPFCVAYAASVERLGQRWVWLRWVGVAVGVGMALTSLAFFVRLS